MLSQHILPPKDADAYRAVESPTFVEFYGKSSQRNLYIGQDNRFPQAAAGATMQHAVIADALTSTGALWFIALNNVTTRAGHGASLADQSDAIHAIRGNNYQPYVTTYCAKDMIDDSQSSEPLAMPLLESANNMSLADAKIGPRAIPAATLSGISRKDILDLPGAASEHVIRWISIAEDNLKGTSIGAVIRLPQATQDAPTDVIVCNVAAGWGTTSIQFHTQVGGTGVVSSQTSSGVASVKPPLDSARVNPAGEDNSKMFVFDYPEYPQRPINISPDWAKYLNPYVPAQNATVFELIMRQEFFPETSRVPFEEAITALMVNGLARVGLDRTLQGSPKTITSPDGVAYIDGNYWVSGKGDMFSVDATQSKDWVKLEVASFLEGYAYNTQSAPPIIAIVILMTYCVLALGHMFYAGISGTSH